MHYVPTLEAQPGERAPPDRPDGAGQGAPPGPRVPVPKSASRGSASLPANPTGSRVRGAAGRPPAPGWYARAMPLDEYHRKRDFSKTPEPRGDGKPRKRGGAKRKPPYFCVQKHLASRLHYDLRLEHGGVLLSWAVPKGPSLDHRDRHLAVQTEDHPREYGDFEGVIPEGYGQGIVMLWDYGTWSPEVDDVGEALGKGDLKFTLDGYKLKGSWALVRTRDRDTSPSQRGRSWLLIKPANWSGALDITSSRPSASRARATSTTSSPPISGRLGDRPRRPRGGATGKALREIIERAAARSWPATTRSYAVARRRLPQV